MAFATDKPSKDPSITVTAFSAFHNASEGLSASASVLAGLAAFTLLISGCDTAATNGEEKAAVLQNEDGLAYRAVGEAELTRNQGALRVSSTESSGGVSIETTGRRKGDFHFQLGSIPDGELFSMTLAGKDGKALARVVHQQTGGKMHPLSVDLSGLGAERFSLELQNNGATLYREENRPLASDTTTLVGLSSEDPDSYHYEVKEIDGEKVTVVEVDYDANQADPEGALVSPASAEGAGSFQVTHVVLIPATGGRSLRASGVENVELTGARSITFRRSSSRKEFRTE